MFPTSLDTVGVLEWQVIGVVALGGSLTRSIRSTLNWSLTIGHTLSRLWGRHRLHIAVYLPCPYVVIPTTVVLMGVYVEGHCHNLALLYVELLQLLFSEDIETALPWILVIGLNDEVLRFPRIASTFGNSLLCRQNYNNLSCNFHFTVIVILLLFFMCYLTPAKLLNSFLFRQFFPCFFCRYALFYYFCENKQNRRKQR